MTDLKKPAFTMLELTMVIVVLGILAMLAIPRLDRDLRQGAEDNIVAAIHYTQHLALVDNKTDPRDADWQQELWHMGFASYSDENSKTRWFYTVSSNTDHGNNVDKNETTVDPGNGKYLYHNGGGTTGYIIQEDESPNIFIGKKYGVDSIAFSGGCGSSTHIAFDHLGRPFKSGIYSAPTLYNGYMKTDCIITVGFENTDITDLIITIEKETGHVSAV